MHTLLAPDPAATWGMATCYSAALIPHTARNQADTYEERLWLPGLWFKSSCFSWKFITAKNKWSSSLVELASTVRTFLVDIVLCQACKCLLKGLEGVSDLAEGYVTALALYFMTQFLVWPWPFAGRFKCPLHSNCFSLLIMSKCWL